MIWYMTWPVSTCVRPFFVFLDLEAESYMLQIHYLIKEKSIFDNPTIASVWFWPSNFKTGYLRPSNSLNRLQLAIEWFC
jgi:hypothetical protein